MALGFVWSSIALAAFVSILFLDRMGAFSSKNGMSVAGKTVLITGGSQGLGRSAGRMLAAKGANVIIVARTTRRLEEALAYIAEGAKDSSKQRFHYISADLVSAVECSRIIAEATSWNSGSPPDVVWCCAGTAHPTLFIDTPTQVLDQQMLSNYFSSAYTAHAALQSWLHPKSSSDTTPTSPKHLIFTSSFAALYGIAGYGAYSPSKCGLRSLCDTLSMELLLYRPTSQVSVHTVYPATICTESYEAENKIKSDVTKMLEEGDSGQTADECAEACIKGLERGDEMIATSWMTRVVMCSVIGPSRRGGGAMWVLEALLGFVMVLVMPIIRWYMDGQVKSWAKTHGPSGMKMEKKTS